MKEPKNIQNEDYRVQAVTTLAKDWISPVTGILHKKGAQAKYSAIVNFKNKKLLFGVPNITALFIDFSYVLWMESQIGLKDENFIEPESNHVLDNTIHAKEDYIIFDLLQKKMASIVFAYTALESFANEYIPENFIFERVKDDKKCTEKYDKQQVEHFLSLEVKLNEILPGIFNVEPLKQSTHWNNYDYLKKLRDRIVHCKSNDRLGGTEKDNGTIWNDLMNVKLKNPSLEAIKIINYYITALEETKKPRWFMKFPYERI